AGQKFRLTDTLPHTPMPPVDVPLLLDHAYKTRADYAGALEKVRAAESTRRAALAERYPSLDFNGNYGAIGQTLANSHGTYAASVGLNIPIFQGGRTRGDVLDAGTELEKRQAELDDLRGRIEYEVQTALLDIQASAKQVEVAGDARQLSGDALAQSRDRFKAGVADNLEVIQAQQAVATANENYVSSLFTLSLGKGALVRSIGGAEGLFRDFVLGKIPILGAPGASPSPLTPEKRNQP
ncbi:MAG: TolC family protein, partial [Bryobacteraceae bacterium]